MHQNRSKQKLSKYRKQKKFHQENWVTLFFNPFCFFYSTLPPSLLSILQREILTGLENFESPRLKGMTSEIEFPRKKNSSGHSREINPLYATPYEPMLLL